MKNLVCIIIFLSSFSALADSFVSKVHSIDEARNKKQPHLILLENGRVVFLKNKDRKYLEAFRKSLQDKETLELEVDETNELIKVQTTQPEAHLNSTKKPWKEPLFSYDPSVVTSSEATSIFQRMRRDYQNDSQCYNRAHIWAWEEYYYKGLKSVKHFLFFTSRYIRNYRYKWWFHVSPSVLVSGMGERILDRRFTSGPRSVSSWTRNFIYSGRSCPVVHKYYDYRNNQESEDCYLIPVSMYFWQPRDIERRDRTGFEKTQFYRSEVEHAYWEAF